MCMKRTNIILDEKLVDETMRLSGIKTIKGVVEFAMMEYIRRERQTDILKLKGKIDWKGDLDELRTAR
jgi:Arc/MetJ family transcription regulator